MQSCNTSNNTTSNTSDSSSNIKDQLVFSDSLYCYTLNGVPFAGIIDEELCYGVTKATEYTNGIETKVKIFHPNKKVAIVFDIQEDTILYYNENGDPCESKDFINEYYYYMVDTEGKEVKKYDKNYSFQGITFGQSYKDFYAQLKEKGFRFIDTNKLNGRFYGENVEIYTDPQSPIVNSLKIHFNNYSKAFKEKLVTDLSRKYGECSTKVILGTTFYTWYEDNGEISVSWWLDEKNYGFGITNLTYRNSDKSINDL